MWQGLLHAVALKNDDDTVWLIHLAFAQVLHNASCFHRRIIDPLNMYPQKLLLLAKSPDTEDCAERRRVARELLDTEPKALEINARKVKALFPVDLLAAASQGLLVGPLRVCIRGVARVWQADTRESERINKQLKLTAERCPTASFELQSSRACIKHFLGEAGHTGSSTQRRKWSTYRPTAVSMLRTCLTAWHDRLDIQEDVTRWQAPPDDKDIDLRQINSIMRSLYPSTIPAVHRTWAACYNMLLNRALAERESKWLPHHVPVICFVQRAPGVTKSTFSYYCTCEKVRSSHRLVQCQLTGNGSNDNIWIRVHRPLFFQNAIDVIASHWRNVVGPPAGLVQICIVKVRRPTDFLCDLSLVGASGESMPEPVTLLRPPSKKMQQNLHGADADHRQNDQRDPDESQSQEHGNDGDSDGDSDGAAHDHEPEPGAGTCGDSDIMEGLHLLMEAADALPDADDDDDGDVTTEIGAACAALNKAVDETCRAAFVSDEIEHQEDVLRAEYREELLEDDLLCADQEKALDAVRTGVCPMLAPHVAAAFPTADMDVDAREQAVEAVLNQATVMGNSQDYLHATDLDDSGKGSRSGAGRCVSALCMFMDSWTRIHGHVHVSDQFRLLCDLAPVLGLFKLRVWLPTLWLGFGCLFWLSYIFNRIRVFLLSVVCCLLSAHCLINRAVG